jgi:hypothetical protein
MHGAWSTDSSSGPCSYKFLFFHVLFSTSIGAEVISNVTSYWAMSFMLNSDVKASQPITLARSSNAYRLYCHLPFKSRHRVFQTHVCQCSVFVLSASRPFKVLYQMSTNKIYEPGLEYDSATYRYDPRLYNQQHIVWNGVRNLRLSSLAKTTDFILFFFWRRQSSICCDEIQDSKT